MKKLCINCLKPIPKGRSEKRNIFCSRSCAAVTNNKKRHCDHIYKCKKCKQSFKTRYKIRSDRKIHCPDCKRKTKQVDIKKVITLKQLAKRTVSKILRRLNLACFVCGWDKCTCDLHHIVPKARGGADTHNNLTYLCPNCHRMAHGGLIQNFPSLENKLPANWKDFYRPI